MAQKCETSEIVFDAGKDAESPFGITGIHMAEDGDICLEEDERISQTMTISEMAEAVENFDPGKDIYFVSIDGKGEKLLYNIKDGGSPDRHYPRMVQAAYLKEILTRYDAEKVFHLESGTINFTINAIYTDDEGCLCLESNEIEELADYTIGLIIEELSQCADDTPVYFYDDEAREYYGIYSDEARTDKIGDLWIKAR